MSTKLSETQMKALKFAAIRFEARPRRGVAITTTTWNSLRKRGLVHWSPPWRITEKGREVLGPPEPLPYLPPLKSSGSCRVCRAWLEGDWLMALTEEAKAEVQRQMDAGRCDDCTRRIAAEQGITESYRCSYCTRTATHVGAGQDADFYCPQHKDRAFGGVDPI